MYRFPEQLIPQALDARRAQRFFLVGLTTILLVALVITVNAFLATQPGSATPQVTTTGPAVYGWLPAPHVQVTDPKADLGIMDASGTGFGITDAARSGAAQATDPNADLGIMDASGIGFVLTDTARTGPAVYGWLPAPQVQAVEPNADVGIMDASEGH